jgi:hypothetical protein
MSKYFRENIPHQNSLLHIGIYEPTCQTCHQVYTGQTSRETNTCYKEYCGYIKTNNQSAHALHILNQHEFGTPDNTVRLIKPCNKNSKILIWENIFIQNYHSRQKLVEEQIPQDSNILFSLGKFGNHAYSSPPTEWSVTEQN